MTNFKVPQIVHSVSTPKRTVLLVSHPTKQFMHVVRIHDVMEYQTDPVHGWLQVPAILV